ncbi:MAG: hypothetical protein HQK49_11720 [Oligoflexia bacterium]|nr:hypothetical protein [Oligoflexia bacterium]
MADIKNGVPICKEKEGKNKKSNVPSIQVKIKRGQDANIESSVLCEGVTPYKVTLYHMYIADHKPLKSIMGIGNRSGHSALAIRDKDGEIVNYLSWPANTSFHEDLDHYNRANTSYNDYIPTQISFCISKKIYTDYIKWLQQTEFWTDREDANVKMAFDKMKEKRDLILTFLKDKSKVDIEIIKSNLTNYFNKRLKSKDSIDSIVKKVLSLAKLTKLTKIEKNSSDELYKLISDYKFSFDTYKNLVVSLNVKERQELSYSNKLILEKIRNILNFSSVDETIDWIVNNLELNKSKFKSASTNWEVLWNKFNRGQTEDYKTKDTFRDLFNEYQKNIFRLSKNGDRYGGKYDLYTGILGFNRNRYNCTDITVLALRKILSDNSFYSRSFIPRIPLNALQLLEKHLNEKFTAKKFLSKSLFSANSNDIAPLMFKSTSVKNDTPPVLDFSVVCKLILLNARNIEEAKKILKNENNISSLVRITEDNSLNDLSLQRFYFFERGDEDEPLALIADGDESKNEIKSELQKLKFDNNKNIHNVDQLVCDLITRNHGIPKYLLKNVDKNILTVGSNRSFSINYDIKREDLVFFKNYGEGAYHSKMVYAHIRFITNQNNQSENISNIKVAVTNSSGESIHQIIQIPLDAKKMEIIFSTDYIEPENGYNTQYETEFNNREKVIVHQIYINRSENLRKFD